MANDTPFDTQGYGSGDTFTSATLASGSSTPTVRSRDVKGGAMQVADVATRDAIPGAALARDHPGQFRQEGMLVFVADRGDGQPETYQLQGGITNGDWVVFGGGGGGGTPQVAVVNTTGGLIENGSLLARSATVGAQSPVNVQKADASDVSLLVSNVFCVLTSGDMADAATGTADLVGPVAVRFKAGLTLSVGEDVFMSVVPGEATNETPVDPVVGSGGSVQRVGVLLHPLTYDGGADRLALVAFNVGQRRQAV